MIERGAVGNGRGVWMIDGKLLRRYPDIRIETVDEQAEFRFSGGVGLVPLTFTGLESHADWQLTIGGEVFDQGVHGSDFWQTDYDPGSKTWSRAFNVPAVGGGEERVIRLSPVSSP